MTKRMLIDSSHAEQTRVVIMEGNTLLEFDSELSTQRALKGNIYLAKVTRVEPSLQAAFVEYGGNRHGFLPFSEIHPDYYRIPVADREALLADQARARRADDFDDDEDDGGPAFEDGTDDADREATETDDAGGDADSADGAALAADGDSPIAYAEPGGDGEVADEPDEDDPDSESLSGDGEADTGDDRPRQRRNGRGRSNGKGRRSDSRDEQDRRRGSRLRRSYTIQEVIKRGQIMLVQVVKEERGTKGAAVTTYLSLAGRYCVLMPNTARGGGISRKITVGRDRSRLKTIVESLEIPGGMAVIVRTAGIGRTKAEIKRDFDYLAKTWEQIREVTLQSRAPALIYEESQLIKRVLRDNYSREIEEVLVQGEAAYREAKDFMKTLMPSHAKRVQPYRDSSPPLFHRFKVDAQLEHLHSPIVQLPSGGYLVINLTEALVAIDINSGRSTRERHIEETALKTNLEAAEEIARQLRLRDLAGLIVIDFIDMEDRRNTAAVERKLKDAMRADRARVQVGRISSLGLLEMSRQRLRPSLLETMMQPCPHCEGTGRIHSTGTSALHVLRALEDHGLRGNAGVARVTVAPDVAFYILNDKRSELTRFERDYNLFCRFEPDASLVPPNMRVEMLERGESPTLDITPLPAPLPLDDDEEAEIEEVEIEEVDVEQAEVAAVGARAAKPRRGQSRRGARTVAEPPADADGGDDANHRRGRRGGRRRRRDGDDVPVEASGPIAPPALPEPPAPIQSEEPADTDADGDSGRGNRRRRRRRRARPETKSLPGIAVFARAATPLAFHIAAEPVEPPAAHSENGDAGNDAWPANGTAANLPAPTPVLATESVTIPALQSEPVTAESDNLVDAATDASPAAASPEPEPALAAVPVEPTVVAPEPGQGEEPWQALKPQVEAEAEPQVEAEAEPQVEAERDAEPALATAAATSERPTAATRDPNQPRRRGWWQRLLE